jgi:hypothetical protein
MFSVRVFLGILFCYLSSSPSAEARIFRRWGRLTDSASMIRSLGGESVYQAPVTINGVRGSLSVFSFAEPMTTCLRRVLSVLHPGTPAATDSAAMTAFTREDERMRLVAFGDRSGEAARTVLFLISVPEDKGDAAQTPPDSYPDKAIPVFPGSRLLFSASNHETDSHFAIAECDTTADAVVGFFSARLAAERWAPVSPVSVSGSFAIYGRPGELCCVYVDRSQGGAPVRLAVLYKRLGSDKKP